jgi:putative hemolysin
VTLQTATTAISHSWIAPAAGLDDFQEVRDLKVSWACCEEDVRQAQRLRYSVFAIEMGAKLTSPTGMMPGLDVDAFDPFCDHLLVRAVSRSDDDDGLLVGTYRVLAPDAARRAGGLYIDTEFDLTPLSSLRSRAVELGRSCVHPSWRSGGVILALWSALCRYMHVHRLETMIGCASVGLKDGGHLAGALWGSLRTTYLVEPRWQVQPHIALPLASSGDIPPAPVGACRMTSTPALIKGYLRCGTRLLGPPALDTAFNTADLPMMLRLSDLTPRYRKHFLGI